MKQDTPILVNGRYQGKVIIDTDRKQAAKAAQAAASHISTPTDTQLCPFSDGSHDEKHRGGVGLAYRRKWLPQELVSEHAATDLGGDFVERAWPYSHARDNMVMEAVGIVEALYAARESIQQHLAVLKKHACTVTVKATTDCMPLLEHIARQTPRGGKVSKAISARIMREIKDLVQALSSLEIKVFVELHWCPRNTVQQMMISDNLAGEARRRGLAYCNATQNFWARATESNAMKELLLVLEHVVRVKQITEQTNNSSTALEKPTTTQNVTEAKRESRATRHTAGVSTTAYSQTAFSLPGTTLPLKPASTSNAEPTTVSSMKPMTSATGDVHPAKEPDKVEAGKRKAEEDAKESEGEPVKKVKLSPAETGKRQAVVEMEESEGMPNEEAKRSPASEAAETCSDREASPTAQSGQQLARRMPATWALNPYDGDVKGPEAPSIRTNDASTKETGEKNVFISDGVSSFSLAQPVGIYLPRLE